MNLAVVLEFVSLFFAGVLAGEEFVTRYGVGRAAATLDERSQIEMRQALIRSLRVLVPAIFVPTVLLGVATTILNGVDPGFGFRCAGVLALLVSLLVTLIGTVPINKATLTWQPSAPPKTWRAMVTRWERLDTVRSGAAVAAFALFLTATALQLAAH